jgi:hypothetical protein
MMEQQLHSDDGRVGRRFEAVRNTNERTGQETLWGIAYEQGNRKKAKLFNVCPWCARDIRFWMTTKERAAKPLGK